MKKLFLFSLPVILLSGCAITPQSPTIDTGMNEKITLLQEQISGLQQEIQALKTNPSISIGNTEVTQQQTGSEKDRYRKIYSKDYSLSHVSTDASFNGQIYKVCLSSNKAACVEIIQYNSTIGDYIYKYVSAPEERALGKREPDPKFLHKISTSRKTWTQANVYESVYYYLQTPYGVLIMPYHDQSNQAVAREESNALPKDLLSFIDYEK